MGRLILVESGSTKTMVLTSDLSTGNKNLENVDTTNFEEFRFSGYNPGRPKNTLFDEIKKLDLSGEDRLFFYGSGLGTADRKKNLKLTFQNLYGIVPHIFDDLTGAARALYGEESGMFAILGTGGISAYFNGTEISNRKGGYGYLIDDFGGGYELGKLTISAWLDNQFSQDLSEAIEHSLGVPKSDFITRYYQDANWGVSIEGLDAIADIVRLLPLFLKEQGVQELLELYFDFFFEKNILPIKKRVNTNELKLVGSIAGNFQKEIEKAANKFEIKITKIMRYPALGLFAYHLYTEQKRIQSKTKD